MLPQVLTQHTSHTITQSVPYSRYENKYNIGTTFSLLIEVRLQTIDPPTKLHTLDSSRSLFPVFGLYAAFNYHIALGPYTTYITLTAVHWAYL